MPRPYANEVIALAEKYDVSYSEMIAEFIRMGVTGDSHIRLKEPLPVEQQELSA